MSVEIIRTACPRDCRDTCALLVEVADGRVTGVRGDPGHEITRGFTCPKAGYEIKRLYSPDRLTHPLIKRNGAWERASWEEALSLVTGKLAKYREEYGSLSVMHYSDAGNMGLLNSLGERFFNLFGGVTVCRGSLCSAAGSAAQKLDFGAVIAHDPVDVLNAKNIILWGRNPAFTNIHLLPLLKEAGKKGAYVTLIDPVPTRTAHFCDQHLAPRPGTDGALALGMARVILDESLEDREFIRDSVLGFSEYARLLKDYPAGKAAEITGLPEEAIRSLAVRYASCKPGSILMGFGLQRYKNGASAVRAVDALAAITGNIGIPGGGVSYSCGYSRTVIPDISAVDRREHHRSFPKPAVARHILEAADPPVKALFVTCANPAAMLPNTKLAQRAIESVEFKVVIDLEMTETADLADVVLPCATFFEQENVYTAWGHNYVTYGQQCVPPVEGVRSDWEIFAGLACRLGFGEEFGNTEKWLDKLLGPFLPPGMSRREARGKSFRCPGAPFVPWAGGRFNTPSGKFELYSQRAAEMGTDPLPVYREPGESTFGREGADYPFYLLSPVHARSIHSQHYENIEPGDLPAVHLGTAAAEGKGICDGSRVLVVSPRGSMTGKARLHEDFRSDVVLIYCGGDHRSGKGVNVLTPDRVTDIGDCATFFDCLCDVKPVGECD